MGQVAFHTQQRPKEMADGINKIEEYVIVSSSPWIQVHRNPIHLVRILTRNINHHTSVDKTEMSPCTEVFKTIVRTWFHCLFPTLFLNIQNDQSHLGVSLEPNTISCFAPENKTCLKYYNDRVNPHVDSDSILRVYGGWGAEQGNNYLLNKLEDSKLKSDMNG